MRLKAPSRFELPKRSDQPVVQIEHAAARIGGRTIWRDVTLSLEPAEFMAVLGPNGAGKSTLLKTILGLAPISDGSITVVGKRPRQARSAVGYVPQRRSFGAEVRIRGRDLVRLGLDGNRWGIPLPEFIATDGRESYGSRVQEALHRVGAVDLADRPIGELSGGEQQRILIAQALVTSPALLLLDEPLESLDLVHQREVSHVIREVSREVGASVILVAHDVNPLLPHVDRICYLAGGHAAVGTPEEVINAETLSRLYGTDIEVFRTQSGQLLVAGQPEGVPCADHHDGELPSA